MKYIGEKELLENYGSISMRDFVKIHKLGYIEQFYKDWTITVSDYYKQDADRYIGVYERCLVHGVDDGNDSICVQREHDVIQVITKPDGESRCWLEIGKFENYQNQYGNKYVRWVKDENRYPHKDSRLEVHRSFYPSCIYWLLYIAKDYPLTVQVISRGSIMTEELYLHNLPLNTAGRTLWKPKV